MNDDLSEAAVGATLTTAWLGRVYRYLPRTGSTNDDLKAWAAGIAPAPPLANSRPAPASPAPHGAVLATGYQSAGRGRLDRRWDAPPDTSLLLSLLLRSGDWPAERGPWLTMLAGLAVAEAIEVVVGLPARLKWPNDVVLAHDEGWRKVCGLLLDTTLDAAGRLETAVVGIGLNVNIPAGQLPAAITPPTSLLVAAGRVVARRPLLAALLAMLERHYERVAAGHSPAEAWSARLITLGQRVQVTAAGAGTPLVGLAEATDAWGRLLVRDDAGRQHTIAAGDVTLRG